MDWILAMAGLGVGALVGLTGVGGGSLMTPFLLFYGIPPAVAVGTDLAYAAIAKSLGVWLRHKARSVDWWTAFLLMCGSIPAAAAVVVTLKTFAFDAELFGTVITRVLAVSLVLTSLTVLGQHWLHGFRTGLPEIRGRTGLTVFAGVVLGALVTISSVGSGAIGTALLLLLYPRWSTARVVGTDLAYAVPLTATAACGHLWLGNVDTGYVFSLVVGAIPGMYIGTRMGLRLPEMLVRTVLGVLLFAVGISLLWK
ncbi:MAG: sulfite exporter TauE/SafE family protein [Halofilum sp. (in: g-proteobacteria)]